MSAIPCLHQKNVQREAAEMAERAKANADAVLNSAETSAENGETSDEAKQMFARLQAPGAKVQVIESGVSKRVERRRILSIQCKRQTSGYMRDMAIKIHARFKGSM